MGTGKGPSRGEAAWAAAMAAPGLILLTTFVLAPLLLGLLWSFTDKRLISPVPTRVQGLANYDSLLSLRRLELEPASAVDLRDILRSDPSGELSAYAELARAERGGRTAVWLAKDPVFWKALFNTLLFVAVIVPCQGGLALGLALLVNMKLPGRVAFRAACFTPVVVSMAVVSVVWIFILNPEQGLLNRFLSFLPFAPAEQPRWLADARWARWAVYLVSIWQSAGFQMVIFLAGLQAIPEVLYESAVLDGAGPLRRFANVTFPLLRNTTVFVTVSTTILAFRVFTQIDVMTRGGPQESTISLIYYVVQKGFREQRVGYASAATFVFFVFVLAVSGLQKVLLKSEREIEP